MKYLNGLLFMASVGSIITEFILKPRLLTAYRRKLIDVTA